MQWTAFKRFAGVGAVVSTLLLFGCINSTQPMAGVPLVPASAVGPLAADRFATPTGQLLTPAGRQIALPGMRPQGLALSAQGAVLAVAGNSNSLLLIDPDSGQVLQTVPLTYITTELRTNATTNAVAKSKSGTATPKTNIVSLVSVTNRAELSFTGLIFSPDDRALYLSNGKGPLWAFTLEAGRVVGHPRLWSLPETDAPKQRREIPSGLAVSPDGRQLYVTGNLGNQLYELDTGSGRLLRSWDTGVAPYDVVLAGHKAYVSNLGGRLPAKGERTALAGLGTRVRVDARDIAAAGSVTVIDLAAGRVSSEIELERHPSALAVSPDGKYLVVANTGSDSLTVIDTATDHILEKFSARQSPADLFGAQPNALVFDPSGRRLYVCNGTQNAVAVFEFKPGSRASRMLGLIPVGWFPGAIQFERSTRTLLVANIKGIGANKSFKPGEKIKYNSKEFYGTISCVALPSTRRLASLTKMALRNMRYPLWDDALQPPRPAQPARPVPERAGEPSLFKHVIYVIKENRTYDQVLGDMPEGNGDPQLCTFGELYTPNEHKIAREFVLLDNTYCAGICSADGHQWTDSALANEYVERQLTAGSPRSYTGAKGQEAVDALAWASSGFIWDNLQAHGKTMRDDGEWMLSQAGWSNPKKKDKILWADFWGAFNTNAGLVRLRSRPLLKTLRWCGNTNTVGWDLKVPDVMRAAQFIRELHQFETNGGFPDLTLLYLPNDHTGGERTDYPMPGSQIADNDLALGRVLDALSHSRFWRDTCLLGIEDDPQSGWDHVSGYRTTCFVASAYTPRRRTVSTQYNQISLVRTIELILGLPPMNQMDASATPMFDCFTDRPDYSPFDSVPNRFPLDKITPEPKKVTNLRLRQDVLASNRLPLDQPDRCPDDLLNRILWRAMKGPDAPYPEWAVKAAPDND